MNRLERVTAVIEGQRPDRPPFSFWYHFGPECLSGPPAVEAHVRHLETYDLDFLKIMDDNRYPRHGLPDGVIREAGDLDKLPVLRGDEDNFGRQLELIGELARPYAGQVLMPTTVFNPWNTLRQMMSPQSAIHLPPTRGAAVDHRDAAMARFLRESPNALARALDVVAESLANFTRQCLAAGADGVFLAVRDDWVDIPENGAGTYDRLARPGDLKILDAAREGRFNLLHVCGTPRDFARFASYPVHAINWADRTAGPAIAEVIGSTRPAIAAGVDNLGTLVTGSPDDCGREVADAIDQAGGRPILVAPGCTFDPAAVPAENLHAIRRAVEARRAG